MRNLILAICVLISSVCYASGPTSGASHGPGFHGSSRSSVTPSKSFTTTPRSPVTKSTGIGNFKAPVTRSMPNAFKGGNSYYNGTRYLGNSRPNVFGGQNYYNNRGRMTQRSTPSAIRGGYNYRNFDY